MKACDELRVVAGGVCLSCGRPDVDHPRNPRCVCGHGHGAHHVVGFFAGKCGAADCGCKQFTAPEVGQ